jgi:hypothetical protein
MHASVRNPYDYFRKAIRVAFTGENISVDGIFNEFRPMKDSTEWTIFLLIHGHKFRFDFEFNSEGPSTANEAIEVVKTMLDEKVRAAVKSGGPTDTDKVWMEGILGQ